MSLILPKCPAVDRLRAIGINYPEKFRARAKQGFQYDPRFDGHVSHAVAAFLGELNTLSGHAGVESLFNDGKPSLWYLNAGDTYAATVFYNSDTDNLFISDLGTQIGG